MSKFNDRHKNDPPDKISAVSLGQNGDRVAIGTEQGHIMLISQEAGDILKTFKAHQSKVTCIHLKDGRSITTSSTDGTLFVLTLEEGAASTRIRFNGKQESVTCFCHVDPDSDKEFIAGFQNGEVIYYKETEAIIEGGVSGLRVQLSTLVNQEVANPNLQSIPTT